MKGFFKKHLYDLIVGVLLLVTTLGVLTYFLWPKSQDKLIAKVYRENDVILTIDLSSLSEDITSYEIEGKQGQMTLQAKYNAVRIYESSCPNQYCVNQGWSSDPNKSLICAHNAVFVTIEGTSSGEVYI